MYLCTTSKLPPSEYPLCLASGARLQSLPTPTRLHLSCRQNSNASYVPITSGFFPKQPSQLSLAYDVDVSDAGMLGAGAYGTVLAAVHRSTGRQVAIKTMLKKYLLSDAEKASVEREIEIQKVSALSAFCVPLGGVLVILV